MASIFLAPRSNETAYENYMSSMQGKSYDQISPYLSEDEKNLFRSSEKFFVWGCQQGKKSQWDAMQLGDYVMFYSKGRFVSIGKLQFKKHSNDLAISLWPKSKETGEPWSYVFFVRDVQEIDISLTEFNKTTEYKFRAVMGFQRVTEEYTINIESKFGTIEDYVRSLTIGLSQEESGELVELSQHSKKDLTKTDLVKLDALTRDRSIEDIEYVVNTYVQKQMNMKPEKVLRLTASFKRNVGMVKAIKQKFENKCQICGFTFKTSAGAYYSEAAHVIPISKAVEGVDSPDNIWILCANHHKMLDRGAITAKGPHSYEEKGEIKNLIKY